MGIYFAWLVCFDQIADPAKKVISGSFVRVEDWLVTATVNLLDDSKAVSLILPSETGRTRMRTRLGNRPTLILYCKCGKRELSINWQDYVGSEGRVTMRVGNSAAVPKMWGLSTSSKTTFYTGDDVRFIKELLLVDKFVA